MSGTSRVASPWYRSRRLRLLLILGLVVTLLAWVGLDLWARRRVDAEYARLERRYGSLDGRSLVATPVADEYNSARFVRAAAALTVAGEKGFSALMASFNAFDKLPESSPVPADVRGFLDANQEAVRLADEARSRHQASWDVDYGSGSGPQLLVMRTLSTAAYFTAVLDIKAGHPDDASRKIATGLAVAASLRHEPSLVPQLIRIAIAGQQCEAVERLIAQSTPSKPSLEELARSLVEGRTPDPLQMGLLAELRTGNTALMRMERGQTTLLSEYARPSIWAGPSARLGRPFLRLGRARYLRDMEHLLQVQAGPRPRPPFPDSSHSRFWDWRRLSDSYPRGLERAIDSGDAFNSMLGVAQLGVALRRYRLDHEGYPDDLSALVPAYLSRLPLDAVTGKPPAYARSGAGFTLKAEPVGGSTVINSALDWKVAK